MPDYPEQGIFLPWLTIHSTIWHPRFAEALKLCVSHSRTSNISTVDQLNKSMRSAWLRMTWISPKCVTMLMTIRLESQDLLSLIRSVFLLFGGKVWNGIAHCELCGALTSKPTGNPCNSHLVCTNWWLLKRCYTSHPYLAWTGEACEGWM